MLKLFIGIFLSLIIVATGLTSFSYQYTYNKSALPSCSAQHASKSCQINQTPRKSVYSKDHPRGGKHTGSKHILFDIILLVALLFLVSPYILPFIVTNILGGYKSGWDSSLGSGFGGNLGGGFGGFYGGKDASW